MMLNSKARQFIKRYFLGMVKSYLTKTLLAQYDAILGLPVPALCYGYAGDGIVSRQANICTASSAPRSPSVLFVLSESSVVCSSPSKSHNNVPPQYAWIKDPYLWRYCFGNIFTGIAIEKITALKLSPCVPYPSLKLKHPSYRITFECPDDERIYDLVETSTLNKAKRLAELYYSEWECINHKKLGGKGVNQ